MQYRHATLTPAAREKLAQALATATLFLAGYAIGDIVATVAKHVVA